MSMVLNLNCWLSIAKWQPWHLYPIWLTAFSLELAMMISSPAVVSSASCLTARTVITDGSTHPQPSALSSSFWATNSLDCADLLAPPSHWMGMYWFQLWCVSSSN